MLRTSPSIAYARRTLASPAHPATRTDMLTPWFVAAVFFGAMVGIHSLNQNFNAGYYAFVLGITTLVYVRLLMLRNRIRHPRVLIIGIGVIGAVLAVNVGIGSGFTVYLLYPVFALGFTFMLAYSRCTVRSLLRPTNAFYLTYLVLSLLVYFGYIELDRSLNTFDATSRVPMLQIQTLIGFYGSTAHIDSLSMLVALVNLAYNRTRSGKIVAVIALIASLLTVRYTPLIALISSVLTYTLLKMVWRHIPVRRTLILLVAASAVFSFALSDFVQVQTDGQYLELSNSLTNGRAGLWTTMLQTFTSNTDPVERWFGSGDTTAYSAVAWYIWHPAYQAVVPVWTDNPHNNYLYVLLALGYVGLLGFFIAVLGLLWRYESPINIAVASFVLVSGITNSYVFSFHFPLFLAWVVVLAFQEGGTAPNKVSNRQSPTGNLSSHWLSTRDASGSVGSPSRSVT